MLGVRHYNGLAIDLFQGDITRFACDAMGNAANAQLAGGGGVDGAIHRVGGPSLMEECRRIGACATGKAVATGAGLLPARHVLHAVGPVWQGGGKGEAGLLASAYREALRLAAGLNCRHVALPAISTGVYGYPLAPAAEVALSAVKAFADETDEKRAVGRVTFVLFSAEHYHGFQEALFRLFPEND